MDLVRFRYGENNINTGPLKEIPEICVDHFLGSDLDSSVFFLSHAHTDHLVGLETEAFIRRLRQPGVKLYCHPLTPILLGSFTRYLQGPDGIRQLIADKKIIPLDVGNARRIRIPKLTGHLDVNVTLLPAGHCPGSVMFLFETTTVRVLHTGDFRLEVDDLKRMPLLHKNGAPKPIDHLYIDTTFCSTSANLFPNRRKVLTEAFEHIRKWLSLSSSHVINISFSAKFAHEYVLLEINRVFNQKIHVTSERLEIYTHIPEIYKIVTLENKTQFHLCGIRNCVENGDVMTLRLSCMWYTKSNKANRDSYISWRGRNNMILCYSMHSSLEEIGKTIDYLKPRVVTPLVLPNKTDILEVISDMLLSVYSAIRSVTESTFELEDYRSGRNDFEGMEHPNIPCNEEMDVTDEINEEIENPCDDNEDMAYDSPEVEESPSKRFKLSEESKSVWRFNLTPSPSSKNSQSSEEGSQNASDGSQENNSQGATDGFLKPHLIPAGKINPRRNLNVTDFKSLQEDPFASNESQETACDNKYDEEDPSVNSQRL